MKQSARICWFIVVFCLFTSFITLPCFAMQMNIEKKTNQTTFSTDQKIYLTIEIDNVFDEDVKIQLEDKNILSDNGIHIECAEYTIPKKTKINVVYSPLDLYEPGKYKLDKAKITYTNPETKKEDEVFSNIVELSVNGEKVAGNPNQLKKIYKCNGTSRESTSFSSSSSSQQSQQNQQPQQQTEEEKNKQNEKMNQMNQNNAQTLDSMKKEMQEQAEKLQKQKQELEKKIEESDSFKQQAEEMKEKGFEKTQENIMPNDENNGNFSYEFKDKDNNSEHLYGDVKNNSVSTNKFGKEEMNNAMQNIEQNKKFRNMENQLEKEGFQMQKKEFSPDFAGKNLDFNYTYTNQMNQTKSIIGNADLEGNITSINLEEEIEEKRNRNTLWLLILLLAASLSYLYYRKKTMNKTIPVVVGKRGEIKYNWKKNVKKHFANAQALFEEEKKKGACQELSFGVKLMFKHKTDSGSLDELKKMTTTDILKTIKDKKLKTKTKKCLETIDMALFAKHKIISSEFNDSMKIAKEIFNEKKQKN
ncbi:MAG: hypothetical protein KAR87_00050 [Candidatus Aenigmarchaeota archaeon]|nr:hypothetical protein [Candidatus Aenigmarchaeota archaeon]